jgi:outer membrane lipase/esterase
MNIAAQVCRQLRLQNRRSMITKMIRLLLGTAALLGLMQAPARGFDGIQVFGDGLSTVTNYYGQSSSGPPSFYGQRFSNGRVWVEVLAERQGVPLGTSNNWSFFGHYSSNLLASTAAYAPTAQVSNTLFVLWVNNADFVDFVVRAGFAPYSSNNIAIWTNAINQSVSNHVQAVQALYAKGARTFLMPVAVDVMKVPYYSGFAATNKAFIRAQIMDFNARFVYALAQLQNSLSNARFLSPDFFSLTDGIISQPSSYGLTNSTAYALGTLADKSFAGPGTNFVFWDYMHPTAKVHEILADTAQQVISPVRIASIAPSSQMTSLWIENVPIGLNGYVEGSTNLAGWLQMQTCTSSNTSQGVTVPVPALEATQFYRLRFPFAWSWP